MAGCSLSHGPTVTDRTPCVPAITPRAGAVDAAQRVIAAGRDAAFAGADEDGMLGVVLGTGLGGLADRLHEAWMLSAADTGWLVPSTATGHAGRVVCGTLGGRGGRRVVMLQGRVHGYEGHAPERLARGVELLAAVGAVVVATLAWLGHGAATEGPGRWLHLVADIVHVLAAALWLGALAAFWLMLSRRSARATDAAMFHQALKGFSGLGTLAVGLLTASGLVNTTFTVGMANLRLAPDTAYGQLLIVKLVLFGLMLVLAASNRFALTPALGRSLQTVDARMASLGRLKRSVILESVVGAALVAVVAILGIQPPPGSGF